MDESNLQNVVKIWKETQGLNNFWACKCKKLKKGTLPKKLKLDNFFRLIVFLLSIFESAFRFQEHFRSQ